VFESIFINESDNCYGHKIKQEKIEILCEYNITCVAILNANKIIYHLSKVYYTHMFVSLDGPYLLDL